MSQKLAFSCDVCGAEKKEVNHWLVSDESNVGIDFHTWEWAVREGQLDVEEAKPIIRRHLCGQACCHRLLDEFLSRQQVKAKPIASFEALQYPELASG